MIWCGVEGIRCRRSAGGVRRWCWFREIPRKIYGGTRGGVGCRSRFGKKYHTKYTEEHILLKHYNEPNVSQLMIDPYSHYPRCAP